MKKVFVIAEAGVNHNGSRELAIMLVDVAVDAKCDCVKFQTFKAENLVNKAVGKADYQKRVTSENESQFEMLKKLELSQDDFLSLKTYCDSCNIQFLSTPFDLESIDFLNALPANDSCAPCCLSSNIPEKASTAATKSIGLPIFKIPSGEMTNLPYLRKINSLGKQVILSTGMATLAEIEAALAILKDCEVTLLHCTTEYPCPFEDVNLNAMMTLRTHFNLPVGYSDHTPGIEISLAAVAMGACVIEKHFTLDRNMEGPDHKASLEPHELKQLVQGIRKIERAMGDGRKIPQPSEMKNIQIARKSIVAKCPIHKGELFTDSNLTTKRPGTGISPMEWNKVIGSLANRNYEEDELI
jgi:N,N'-diacetyllegionaminate synthase